VSLPAPRSWLTILGGAVVLALIAQLTHDFVAIGVVAAVGLAAVIGNRDRVVSHLQGAEENCQALLAERSALSDITTAIAHRQALEKTFPMITGYVAKLLGGARAQLEPLAGTDLKAGAGRVRAIVMAGDHKWGTLVVEGVTASDLPAAKLQLLQRFADLAGLAVSGDLTREQLLTQANTDTLTGLANQRAFHRELAEEMSRARRHRRPLALILLDVDQFQSVNATEGQAGGDLALKEIATRIRGALRLEAHVARLGGDEIAILLPECDSHGAYVTAERVRTAIAAAETRAGNRLTASAGVAALEFSQDAAVALNGTTEDLIRAADSALHAAKRMGGDNTVKFTPKLDPGKAVSPETLRAPRADVAQSA
jgi:diguanylate cyclase (GGDEF)-like protein